MARMTKETANEILSRANAHGNFHALPNATVVALLEYAKEFGYRKPKNANGSTGRYFHAYLTRLANRED